MTSVRGGFTVQRSRAVARARSMIFGH